MKKTITAQDQTFWYLQRAALPCLRESLQTDVVIVGGGMAGLTAAQAFMQKNKKVVLLEAYYCGAGASGKSSGFITPNCEISLSIFIERYGKEGAQRIWKTIESGVQHIRKNIEHYNLDCDYARENSLLVANSQKTLNILREEHQSLSELGYGTNYIEKEKLPSLLNSQEYYGGVTYTDTFGISAYKYCQEMRAILSGQGARIYEETPVLSIKDHQVETLHATVEADKIIVCTDHFTSKLGMLSQEVYHVQNYLLISQVLNDEEKRLIFPADSLMVWDTDLIYSYFRMAGQRLLLGGGSLLYSYGRTEKHNNKYVYNKLTNYFKKKFPQLELQFEQLWPGLIGVSKDIAPLAGPDKINKHIYYIAACAGLPIAAALANYCAEYYYDGRDDLKDYFSPYRTFPIGGFAQKILGTQLSFAISNFIAAQ